MERRDPQREPPLGPSGSSAREWEDVPLIVEGDGMFSHRPEPAAPTLRVQAVAGRVAVSVDELRVPAYGARPLPTVRVIQKVSPHAPTVGRLVLSHIGQMASLARIERLIRDYSEMEGSPD